MSAAYEYRITPTCNLSVHKLTIPNTDILSYSVFNAIPAAS